MDLALQRDIRQWLETFLVVTKRKRRYWHGGIKVKDVAKHSRMHRPAPLNKELFISQIPIAPRLKHSGLK